MLAKLAYSEGGRTLPTQQYPPHHHHMPAKKTKKELSEYMSKLGKKGGKAKFKKYGKEHMSAMAKKSWKGRKIVKI